MAQHQCLNLSLVRNIEMVGQLASYFPEAKALCHKIKAP